MTNMTFCVVTQALCADVYETQTLLLTEYVASSFSPLFPQLVPVILRENKYQLCPSSSVQGHRRARHCTAPRPERCADRKSNPGSENKNLSRHHFRANKDYLSAAPFFCILADC